MRDMFFSIAKYAGKYRMTVVLLFASLLFESMYDVGVRYAMKFVIDKAVVEGDLPALMGILILLAIGAVFFNFVVIASDFFWAKIGGRIINDIRFDMFKHLQSLPVGFYRRQSSGDLTARFNADVGQIENGMVLAFPMALAGLAEIVMTLALMLFVHPILAGIAAAGILFSLMMPRIVQGRALDASFVLRREEGRMMGFLQENLGGQSVIKAYSLESHTSKDFSRRLDELLSKLARANFLSYLVSRLPSLSFLMLQLVVLGVGGWLTINGHITVGDLVAYQALLIGLNSAIHNLTWMVPSFIDATAGWQRIREILDEPLGIQDRPGARELGRFSQCIDVEKVSFRYPSAEVPTLNKVDLKINAGDYIVFVGRSGAGKSSIINLILRFYEVTDGKITIDGQDLRDVTMASLRSQIGLVSQEITLFDAPVKENIRLGALEATDEDVIAAAKAAEIHDLIMSLPEGYDTLAGTSGSRFSGGERQRIALARALVRKPAILVLDEFSSALDPTTEGEILQTIEKLKGTCTILSVTHRLSMAERADKVVVMRAGRIAEMGAHAELIGKRGEYSRLWKRAASEERGVLPSELPPAPGTE